MTINSTPKDPSANSYLSVEEADVYFSLRYDGAGWLDFDLEKKEQLLVTSTNRLEMFVYGGYKTSDLQALEWPRTGIVGRSGALINSDIIHINVKKATCEMAHWLVTEEDRMLSDIDLQQIESFKAGPLDIKAKAKPVIIPPLVEQNLQAVGPGALIGTSEDSSQSVSMCR